MKRRQFVGSIGAAGALGSLGFLSGCASTRRDSGLKVVVVGGGFGGATAAKYVRMWSDYGISVTLVEPNASFISCPMSNLVIGGSKTMADITLSYDALVKNHGVKLVRDAVTTIDPDKRLVRLAGGGELPYDRLILSPGTDFMWEILPGMAAVGAQDQVLHAWKAGAQTLALRQQLEAMPDGGVYALTIPLSPYRCPPGPYERACQVASYFSQFKPKSKVLILDANDDVTSKAGLFKKAWADLYPGMVEYRPRHTLADVDAATGTLKFEFNGDVKANVLNVLPNMRAGDLAVTSGLATANKRWCEVDFLTFESKVAKNIHIIGDAIQTAPAMPKSGHIANQHGKTCAAAVVALLIGKTPNQAPIYNNVCYSFMSAEDAAHVSSIHAYDAQQQTMVTVPGSGGVSKASNELEGRLALAWARGIWTDTLS